MPPDEPLDNPDDESPVIRDLRQKAKRADDLDAEVTKLRSENAILGAGLTGLNDRQRKALLAAHDGDLDADALKVTASELGFVQLEETAPVTPPEERAAHDRVAAAGAGADPAGARPDPMAKITGAQTEDEYWQAVSEAGLSKDEGQVFSPRI